MNSWKIAIVQMDCRLGDKAENLKQIRRHFAEAASQGALLVIFPECALTGYAFESKEEAWPLAEPLAGPTAAALAADSAELEAWVVVGFLEADGGKLYNAAMLIGPGGLKAGYRKVHLPCLGVDRFATAGDRPFAVHDLGGLRLGMAICYDASFPEAARVLTLLGADLIVLPTNWPKGAANTAKYAVPTRAMENHIYFAAADRVGEERGWRFIGQSQIVDYEGNALAAAGDREEVILAEIEPEKARAKRVIHVPGKYEVDRIGDRRPEMYELLCSSQARLRLRKSHSPGDDGPLQ
jgi:predicted amidohydrolase